MKSMCAVNWSLFLLNVRSTNTIARITAVRSARKEKEIQKKLSSSNQRFLPLWLERDLHHLLLLHGDVSEVCKQYALVPPGKDWKQYGAEISRTTLANWIIYCAQHYFQPVYDYFHRELLKRSFLMGDETRVQVLNEPERRPQSQSFMWLFRSGEDGLPVIILYGYSPTRSGDNAVKFLDGFSGYLETDGYQGYNKVPGIKRCSCWAHIRRYFIDAIPKGKQFDYSQPAVQGVQYCDRLFRIEDSINKQHPGDYENVNSFVSRKKNRFSRRFGRGSIASILQGTPGWTKR